MGRGGIVSPLYPWRYSPAVTALAHWSQDFYPQLGERLLAETGVDPEVHVTGLYWLDLHDEAEALSWAERYGRPLTSVSMEAVRQAVPSLGEGYERAVYMEGSPTFAIPVCCAPCVKHCGSCRM